jgi:hypothetical protein
MTGSVAECEDHTSCREPAVCMAVFSITHSPPTQKLYGAHIEQVAAGYGVQKRYCLERRGYLYARQGLAPIPGTEAGLCLPQWDEGEGESIEATPQTVFNNLSQRFWLSPQK